MKYQIVSRHLLRRRARARLDALKAAQKAALRTQDLDSRAVLANNKIGVSDLLHVEKARRGPWRWYVVAG